MGNTVPFHELKYMPAYPRAVVFDHMSLGRADVDEYFEKTSGELTVFGTFSISRAGGPCAGNSPASAGGGAR
jgi:hypothetical protein